MRRKTTIDSLRAACLPFTTRLLRQPRLRRHATIALVIAAVTVLTGLWLGLGSGDTARGARRGLGFEQGAQTRAVRELHVVADDTFAVSSLERSRARILEGEGVDRHNGADARIQSVARTAHLHAQAAMSSDEGRAHAELRRQVQAVIERGIARGYPTQPPQVWFDWDDEERRAWLRRYVEVDGIPTVSRYTSPVGVRGLAGMIGTLAASALLLLTMVIAPLWVGTVVAQEVAENTLQPLAATALTKRQLALGLLLGPLAVVGIHAAPLAVLVLSMGAVAGNLLAALGLLIVGVIAMVVLSVMAQMFALQVGRRRAPGTVGVLLSAILGSALLAGVLLAIDVPRDAAGLMTALPQAAATHLLRAAFLPHAGLEGVDPLRIDLGIAIACAGLLVLGAATLRAIERRLAAHRGGLLTAGEAAGVAIAVTFLAASVLWRGPSNGAEWTILSMAGVTPAYLLLLMARVPGGDLPTRLRVVPLTRLLGELALWYGATLFVAVLVGPPWSVESLSVIGVVHLAWAFVVAGLASIRLAAAPAKLWPRLFIGFALFCAWVSFMTGGIAVVTGDDLGVFPLAHLPGPLFALGLLVAGGVPWGLLAELSALGVRLSPKEDDGLPA